VSLGLKKQMGDDPWMGVNRRYPQSLLAVRGKITNIADYGAFVELEPGIEGPGPRVRMDWTNKNVAKQACCLGRQVEIMVPGNRRRRRISGR
jgi:small subunit ribosomal protein S1